MWRGLSEARRDASVALVLALSAGALYGATLCRGVYWYDSAEYVTAAVTLGVPHPPGYPLYTLLAHAFTWLPLPADVAVNAMSALFAAVAVALAYLCARALEATRYAAAGAASLLSSSGSFWLNATIAEVYAPGLCCVLGVLWLLLSARARDDHGRVLLAAALAGAGMGIHYSLASLGLGFALLALAPRAGLSARPQRLIWLRAAECAGIALLSYACVFSYLLARAGSDVVPNQAYPPSVQRELWLLTGGNYRLWFDHDDSLAHALEAVRRVVGECSALGAALAALGLAALFRRDRTATLALAGAIAGNLGFFFRYRVEDLEVFLLPSVALLCLLAALGADALAHALARRSRQPAHASIATGVLLALVAGARVVRDFAAHDLSAFTAAYDYGARLTNQLPSNAVILNYTTPDEWKRHAVFGMYFQHVLHARADVKVVDNADRPILDRLLREGRPTYLYVPVEHVAREYVLAPEGDLQRLVRHR